MGIKMSWDDRAWDDYQYWRKQDKKTFDKVNSLFEDIMRNPFNGIGKPEPLRGDLSGWWSRRIDQKHRIVYCVKDGVIIIASCKGHYDD